jgi:hypothetical protein
VEPGSLSNPAAGGAHLPAMMRDATRGPWSQSRDPAAPAEDGGEECTQHIVQNPISLLLLPNAPQLLLYLVVRYSVRARWSLLIHPIPSCLLHPIAFAGLTSTNLRRHEDSSCIILLSGGRRTKIQGGPKRPHERHDFLVRHVRQPHGTSHIVATSEI